MAFVEVKEISKEYENGNAKTYALNKVSFSLPEGTFNVVLGPSGSGKTTMLNMLGGMDSLSSGQISIRNEQISKMSEKQLTEYRRKSVGFVFQFYNIIPSLTILENVDLVRNLNTDSFSPKEILERVGLKNRMSSFPQDLSGGELQRVSIARAVCKNPDILLCDEPTGALDSETGKSILKLLQSMSKKYHKTVIVVTHNATIAEIADNVVKIKDGHLNDFSCNEHPLNVEEIEW
ncbi:MULTISPECIES: ABC transporter ATP-binding protein [Latilactobacillus]|uniref:ABC transporter ATP-binding protein n=1 Tax=Latilactobacillus TaxID=2767885 RepID=UPI00202F4192|nr:MULTISPECIES: ABC transporter ATP-binding protein [Latilactobacillus]MCM1635764.1 ABC transporter ATP-binding protein [Latilactobacillus sakei]MCW8780384.1 ABC transporter ATP-binding protein [Latilactobacillus curvatus]